MTIIKNTKTSIDEIINSYSSLRNHYSKVMEKTIENFAQLDHNKDTRIVSLKFIIEPIQTNIILLHLVKDNFGTLSLWENQTFANDVERNEFLNNRLYFIQGDLREGLFINVFLRFESFMKIIASSIEINGDRINSVCKDVIDKTAINPEYKSLIDLFTYSRNTIHSEGFHTKNSVTVTYKENSFNFVKNSPLLFYNLDFLIFMLIEIGNLMEDIINCELIAEKQLIEHSYANLTFEYE